MTLASHSGYPPGGIHLYKIYLLTLLLPFYDVSSEAHGRVDCVDSRICHPEVPLIF